LSFNDQDESTHAIANAARLIMNGRCDAMIAGSAEATVPDAGPATTETPPLTGTTIGRDWRRCST
jgi:3-oxoacyl-(acyl-carrier-protein) synthase